MAGDSQPLATDHARDESAERVVANQTGRRCGPVHDDMYALRTLLMPSTPSAYPQLAFAVSFLALRDLMRAIGYSSTTAWIFPAIIDTAVAVSTRMLVALGDKPARRGRTVTMSANTQTPTMQRLAQPPTHAAKAHDT
jgi:Protein of unknown function (DUF2637)